MTGTENTFIIEFYTTGSKEPYAIEVHDEPYFDLKSADEYVEYVRKKGFDLDVQKPMRIYDVDSIELEVDEQSEELEKMGRAAILNPYYGSSSVH